ncbi:MAG: hypothetical protein A2Z14_00940 [Chloroflexi bacterium RBG_16_48_8]|nr:MAG: hypothetical protein A2Z14_00940 [Chloroflexi bacterium RBG_16_48_8]
MGVFYLMLHTSIVVEVECGNSYLGSIKSATLDEMHPWSNSKKCCITHFQGKDWGLIGNGEYFIAKYPWFSSSGCHGTTLQPPLLQHAPWDSMLPHLMEIPHGHFIRL